MVAPRPGSEPPATPGGRSPTVLAEGELHYRNRFGPATVNRGAVLLECEWDGGTFESGMMLGGIFRSGRFAGGFFSGAIFLDGEWSGGVWHGGYDATGRYRPRTDAPPHRPESGG